MLKTIVQAILAPLGVKLVRLGGPANRSTMESAMRALAARHHKFNTVIDIGASTGLWSERVSRYFPRCQYLLVEAWPAHEPALRQYCARHANAQYVLAAAGERPGTAFFEPGDDAFAGRASTTRTADCVEVPVTTIDTEVAARKLPGSYLLKFDTHGFELPILKGASATLAETEVVVMECYNFHISPECLIFPEMCAWLGKRGFRCIDLIEPLYRPYDGSFWQMDLVFVKSDRPEFSYQGYR